MVFAPRSLLTPLGVLYGATARLRAEAYRRGWRETHHVEAPVFSVGNLTTGGTGKTPLTAWVARVLTEQGRRVCVLTRGYGRAQPHERVLVSDGTDIYADAAQGGDEPRWLAENLPGVAVLADRDRVAAARWALENLGTQCFVLDDGFQHLRMARDCDLVTIDATNPWDGGQMLPRGRLREPLTALRRADACVITRVEQVENVGDLQSQVHELSGGRPVFLASARVKGVRPLRAEDAPLAAGASVLAFCGIGNPLSFFGLARKAGYRLTATRVFRDHHRYNPADIAHLAQAAREAGAEALLTTAKDAVKLAHWQEQTPLHVLDMDWKLSPEQDLRGLLQSKL